MPIAAGKNAALVVASEQRVGYLDLATQLGGGNPGLPQPGSLQYNDYVSRGLIAPVAGFPGTTAAPSTPVVSARSPVVSTPTRPPTSVGSSLRTVPANTQVAAVQAGSAVVAQHTVGNQKNVILQQQHNLSARDRAVTVQMSSLNQHATVAGSLHGTAQDWVTRFLQSIGAK